MCRTALKCCICIALLTQRAICASIESTPLPPPSSGSTVSAWSGAWRVAIALLVVAVLLFGIRALLRRLGRGAVVGGGRIEVIERKPLGVRHSLMLVRVGRRSVLIHQAGGRMHPLCTIDEEESQ